MSKWECRSGHVLEGLFFDTKAGGTMPGRVSCPFCGSSMALTNAEGATLILHRIRDFLGKVVENPEYRENAPEILADLDQLEITIKRISEEALRP